MIPLEEFKRSLRKRVAITLTEEEILRLREVQDLFAEAVVNALLAAKRPIDKEENPMAHTG